MTHEDWHPELVKKRARTIAVQRTLIVILAVVVGLGFSVIVANAVASFQSRAALLDCTQPEGKCFKRNQSNLTATIDDLVNRTVRETIENAVPLHRDTRAVSIIAAYCADKVGSQGYDEIKRCVDKLMLERK